MSDSAGMYFDISVLNDASMGDFSLPNTSASCSSHDIVVSPELPEMA
jgi:hypothetical protein